VVLLLAACTSTRVQIPEPMVFDLVRQLGAEKGEIEINALFEQPLDSSDPTETMVAPEIEYAFADGFGLELELPFEGGKLESVKAAAQWTLGERGNFVHGTQIIVERLVQEDGWDLSALYIPAFRFNDTWSALAMFGAESISGPGVTDDLAALANLTVFARLNTRLTAGLELNSLLGADAGASLLVMPQLQIDITDLLTVQLGLGASYLDAGARDWFPQFALRVILEF